MQIQTIAYDVGQRYVMDHIAPVAPDIANRLFGLLRSRSHAKLAGAESLFSSHSSYGGVRTFLRQISAFFKKNADFTNDEEAQQAALSAFMAGEKQCRITNRRLDHYYLHPERLAPDMQFWIGRMQSWIQLVLGDPNSLLHHLDCNIRVTAGASATRPRAKAAPYLKIGKRISCTPGAAPYLQMLSTYYGYGKLAFRRRLSNRVEFVPKDWRTHRTIACEPDGNLPLQLAFDNYAKKRLYRFGIDLSDQSSNQCLARRGSVDGSFATIDLKAASDTLSFNAVAWLLPYRWFEFLNAIRSPRYSIQGSPGEYAKFSSMGNGATFALETLIFAAACHAVGSKEFKVYGDDIAIETPHAPDLIALLGFLGFTTNREKTFTEGPFRESCGADYLDGEWVTPFYIRTSGRAKTELCHNVNGLVSIALPYGHLWKWLRQYVTDSKLPLVPFNEASSSGVWIDATTSYRLRILSVRNSVASYRAYVAKTKVTDVADSRSLFLWYLRTKFKGYRGQGPGRIDREIYQSDPNRVSSGAPILVHKFVRKWVCWQPPARTVPIQVHTWSDFLELI